MRRPQSLIAVLFLVGCGGSQPAAQPVAVPIAKPVATAPAARAPLFIEYLVIRQAWVEKVMPAEPATLQAWAAESGLGGDVFWHILVKSSKKDADAVQAELRKGQLFPRVARDLSDDPGSSKNGGYYPVSQVENFVPEVKAAFAKLKSGETTPSPVKSSFGWHIIKKAPLGAEELEPLYRKAKAPELTSKLATDLKSRLRTNVEMRPAIADSVTAVLGELASSDDRRPNPVTVEKDELKTTHRLPDAAKTALSHFAETAKPGDLMDDAVLAGGEIVVARAATATP